MTIYLQRKRLRTFVYPLVSAAHPLGTATHQTPMKSSLFHGAALAESGKEVSAGADRA